MPTFLLVDVSSNLTNAVEKLQFKDVMQKGQHDVCNRCRFSCLGLSHFLDALEKQLPEESVALGTYSSSSTLLHDFTTVSAPLACLS